MAQDKTRDFSGIIIVLVIVLFVVGLWKLLDHLTAHGPEQIESFYVQKHSQDITVETRDGLINSVLTRYSMDTVCFDNYSGIFIFHIPEHTDTDGWLKQGWYMVSSYKFIQLQNKSYVIDQFSNPVSVAPDLTGIFCRNQEIKN